MGSVACLARVVNFVGTFPLDITIVPFGARWGVISFSLCRVSYLPLLVLLRHSLDSLHHACGIHLGADAGPGGVAVVQVREDPGIVVSGSVPGIRGEVRVSGEHGGQLQEV